MHSLVPAALLALAAASAGAPHSVPTPADLAGEWTGTLAHDGDSVAVGFAFTPDTSGRVSIAYTLPELHFDHATVSVTRFAAAGDTVKLGPFRFAFDRGRGELRGLMPAALFPVYDVVMTLRRGAAPLLAPRPAATSTVTPAWTFTGDSAMWAGPVCRPGWHMGHLGTPEVVYVGTLAGTLYALDADSGQFKWHFHAGGAIRSRIAFATDATDAVLYLHADDGWLYKLNDGDGSLAWKVRLEPQPVVRLPYQDPHAKFDRFSSDVVVAAGQL